MNKEVCEISITNPEKIISKNITKFDIIKYYEKIATKILPYINNRPISEVRCHDGFKDCFFKKHPDKTDSLIYVKTKKDLILQAQLGTIELHAYGHKTAQENKPDIMIFDLDPDEKMSHEKLVDGVLKLKNLLDKLNLKSFLKTSGGKGYHVVVPFCQTKNYKSFEKFAQKIATLLEATYPNLFTTNIRKDNRHGKIFVDFLRNKKGSTCVAPYSLRARENLPISFPISWKNLKKIKPNEITIKNYRNYLKSNPWKNFFNLNQKLEG